MQASAMGTVHLTTPAGGTLILRDVLYVPMAGVNLISVRRLAKEGMRTSFDDDGCYITIKQTGALVVSGGISSRSDLYILTSTPASPTISAFTATLSGPEATAYAIPARVPTLETWHRLQVCGFTWDR